MPTFTFFTARTGTAAKERTIFFRFPFTRPRLARAEESSFPSTASHRRMRDWVCPGWAS